MKTSDVELKIKETLSKYNAFVSENADYYPFVTSMIFYKNEDDEAGFLAVHGFYYDGDGKPFFDDAENFISEMIEGFEEEYGY